MSELLFPAPFGPAMATAMGGLPNSPKSIIRPLGIHRRQIGRPCAPHRLQCAPEVPARLKQPQNVEMVSTSGTQRHVDVLLASPRSRASAREERLVQTAVVRVTGNHRAMALTARPRRAQNSICPAMDRWARSAVIRAWSTSSSERSTVWLIEPFYQIAADQQNRERRPTFKRGC